MNRKFLFIALAIVAAVFLFKRKAKAGTGTSAGSPEGSFSALAKEYGVREGFLRGLYATHAPVKDKNYFIAAFMDARGIVAKDAATQKLYDESFTTDEGKIRNMAGYLKKCLQWTNGTEKNAAAAYVFGIGNFNKGLISQNSIDELAKEIGL